MKDVRAEMAQIIYEKPIYPKNRYMNKVPAKHADYKRDVIDNQVALMQKRGIWKKPASSEAKSSGASKSKRRKAKGR